MHLNIKRSYSRAGLGVIGRGGGFLAGTHGESRLGCG
jgi:hypothetical protein